MQIDLGKLRGLREKAGLTRAELAIKFECREHTIVRWELGETKNPLPIYKKALFKFYKENGN
jgi:DNA-binding XRE family transcriptional regulator